MILGVLLACQSSQKQNKSSEVGLAEFSFTQPIEIPTDLFMDAIDLDGDSFVDIILKDTSGSYSWSKGNGEGEFSSQGLLWDGAIESEFFAGSIRDIAVISIIINNKVGGALARIREYHSFLKHIIASASCYYTFFC